jgi:anti-sigma factor RsiW
MTCLRYEGDLALYVEGDLPEPSRVVVEAHLAGCGVCRAFLDDLRHSQQAVHDLAAAPMLGDAFLIVQEAPSAAPARLRPLASLRWTIAAGLAAALTATGVWIERPTPIGPPENTREPQAKPASTFDNRARQPGIARAVPPEGLRSTVRRRTAVSPDVTRTAVVPALSKEDADQLARAVVAISKIQRLTDALEEGQQPRPPSLMRVATNDPNVVIYWRLE